MKLCNCKKSLNVAGLLIIIFCSSIFCMSNQINNTDIPDFITPLEWEMTQSDLMEKLGKECTLYDVKQNASYNLQYILYRKNPLQYFKQFNVDNRILIYFVNSRLIKRIEINLDKKSRISAIQKDIFNKILTDFKVKFGDPVAMKSSEFDSTDLRQKGFYWQREDYKIMLMLLNEVGDSDDENYWMVQVVVVKNDYTEILKNLF